MSLPTFIWIEIGIIVAVVAGVLLTLVWKRGIKGSGKGINFVIAGTGKTAPPSMSRALLYLEKSVPEMQEILFNAYLGLMEDKGLDKGILATYDDSLYMGMLLRYAVSGGNGSHSVQKILEEVVVDGEYKRDADDIETYVLAHVWPRIRRSLKGFINSDYHSEVHGSDGYIRRRKVDATEYILKISEGAVADSIVRMVVSILRNAKQCVETGCEDREGV